MIHVVATIEIAPGKRDDFLAVFHHLVPSVRAEVGCIDYGATIDLPTDLAMQIPLRDNVVTIIEKWENFENLQDHLQAPHMLEYREKVKELVQGVSLQVLEPT